MSASSALSLSGCPLVVNWDQAANKPIALNNMTVGKPIDVRLDAGIAVIQLPPVRVTLDKKLESIPVRQ
jgi:hypothetical protein